MKNFRRGDCWVVLPCGSREAVRRSGRNKTEPQTATRGEPGGGLGGRRSPKAHASRFPRRRPRARRAGEGPAAVLPKLRDGRTMSRHEPAVCWCVAGREARKRPGVPASQRPSVKIPCGRLCAGASGRPGAVGRTGKWALRLHGRAYRQDGGVSMAGSW